MANKIEDRAMLVTLSIGMFSPRKTDKKVTREVIAEHQAVETAGKFVKQIFPDDALEAIKKLQSEARQYHYKFTAPWLDEGPRILPSVTYMAYVDKMRAFKRRWDNVLVPDIMAKYPAIVAAAPARLGTMFNRDDYPDADTVAGKFTFRTAFLPFPSADDFRVTLGGIPAEEEAELRAQHKQRLVEAGEAIQRDLWLQLKAPLEAMASSLANPDAKFRDTLVGNLKDIVGRIPALNLTGDTNLETIRRQVLSDLTRTNPEALRQSPSTRRDTAERANAILANMAGYLGGGTPLASMIVSESIAETPELLPKAVPIAPPPIIIPVYPLMCAVDLSSDCFVLNPGWDLHFYREPLANLAKSDLATVREAFAAKDGRTAKDTVDSTVASLCIALDRSSCNGEGFLIANEATLQRLILGPSAPHRALASHVWAHLVIAGNICQDSALRTPHSEFRTGVLYFSRGHDVGLPSAGAPLFKEAELVFPDGFVSTVTAATERLHGQRLYLHQGREAKSFNFTKETPNQWRAIGEEWARLHGGRAQAPCWNLWLGPDGTIATCVSLFDTQSSRVTTAQAQDLFTLTGKQPMQLVMQRAHRAHLEKAAFGTTWRVAPKLQEAIREAVAAYHAIRAPLYPLSPVQRLGYLDEHDQIVCTKDLFLNGAQAPPTFLADHSYALRSTTVAVRRTGTKVNLEGGRDQVEWNGQELAFFITDETGVERMFMEERLRDEKVRVAVIQLLNRQRPDTAESCTIDFTLTELVAHFVIPDVFDVARVDPVGYQRNLDLITEIESVCL